MEKQTNNSLLNQRAFRQNVERLQTILSATHQGWFEIDLLTMEGVVNDQYSIMLGYDPASFKETIESWYQRVHPEDLPLVRTTYLDYITGKRPDYRVEFRERTCSGEWIWILSVGAVVAYDEQSKPIKLAGTRLDISARKQAEQRQREADQRLAFTLDAAKLGEFTLDLRTGITLHSMQHDRCFGYTEPIIDWDYKIFLSHIVEEDRERINSVFLKAKAGGENYEIEFRVRWPDGAGRWLWSKGCFFLDENGNPKRAAGIVGDITNRKQAEAAALAGELRYRLLLENSMHAILQVQSDGLIISANPAACTLFCANESDLLASHCDELLDSTDPRLLPILKVRIDTGHARGEVQMIRKDGARFETEVTTALYKDHGGAVIASLFIQDITERKKAAAEINRLAYFDQLTGLPNRRWLMEHLDEACRDARADKRVDAMLFMDLDHFKLVNDVRGHAVGDALLKCMADRIRDTLGTRGTAGRLGGDEFVIHIANVATHFESGAEVALRIAHEICLALQPPVEIDGQVYTETVSIGVTLFPKAAETANDLLREADIAMYRAKAAGRNQVIIFEARMQAELEFQLELERNLALALKRDEFHLHCQPQVDRNGALVGAELLLRWTQAEKESISPAVFIPLAEKSDLILRIGNWVIDAACRIEVKTRQHGLTIPISINISPKQFKHPGFISQVKGAIASTNACATRLIFEVTEGLLIEDMKEIVERMNALRAIGVRFSIDDFGTGYSSLAYLKQLPLYELKIDKSFVKGLPADVDDVAIVQSMLSIAKHLQLRVVAEGVETSEQASFLEQSGCDGLQGYLFGRPVPVEQFLLDYV
jgi:diguanylate cyclase (GGDEF)-like protein/PAS domain S-box-containing protein